MRMSAPKGALILRRYTAPLKRCPDTNVVFFGSL
jgi:hypothetical protein